MKSVKADIEKKLKYMDTEITETTLLPFIWMPVETKWYGNKYQKLHKQLRNNIQVGGKKRYKVFFRGFWYNILHDKRGHYIKSKRYGRVSLARIKQV